MLPFIIAGAAAFATGLGIGNYVDGKEDIKNAQIIADNAKQHYDLARKSG